MRIKMIAGLIVMLSLAIGVPGLSTAPASADMTEIDMVMMKSTGDNLMAIKQELATLQAEIDRLKARHISMSTMLDKAASSYCASVPDALLATGFVPGLCR